MKQFILILALLYSSYSFAKNEENTTEPEKKTDVNQECKLENEKYTLCKKGVPQPNKKPEKEKVSPSPAPCTFCT